RAEQHGRRAFAAHVFRMPLHADVKRMGGIFEPFDDAIRRMRRDAQSLAHVSNGLVMRGVHIELLLAEDLAQSSALLNQDLVTMAIARLAGVIDLGLHFGGDVLDQRSAGGSVHPLPAKTDSPDGN